MSRGSIHIVLILIAGLTLPLSAFSEQKIKNDSTQIKMQKADANVEKKERVVDQAALTAQRTAMARIEALLKKYKGTSREAGLIARLAEIQQQNAAMEFRIANSMAAQKQKAVDLSKYKRTMKESIVTLDRLISKFKEYEEIDRAYYMRGKAYEEIGDRKAATHDYEILIKKSPDLPETISAYMSLADFAIDENQHARAIDFLEQIEIRPYAGLFPFALYKLAWSHFNLNHYDRALAYLEKHIKFFGNREKEQGALSTSDIAITENSLMDVTTMYLEGIEKKASGYELSKALPYFRKLDIRGVFGRMAVRFAKLLRAHDLESDLVALKNEMIKTEPNRSETLEIVLTTFEYQMNRKRYANVTETAKDYVTLYQLNPNTIQKWESYQAAQAMLLNSAKQLRELTIKNKKATRVSDLSNTLAAVYDTFTKIVDSSDPRIPGVHYNLAETLFEIQDYERATFHYRWVMDNWKQKDHGKSKSVISLEDTGLKAIASRYEVLKTKKLLPKEIEPKSLTDNKEHTLEPVLTEWLTWIDMHESDYKNPDTQFDQFVFESNRARYHHDQIKEAVQRLIRYSRKKPQTAYGVPSAKLALDTLVKSKSWDKTLELANLFLKVPNWKEVEFPKKLTALAADSSFKIIENINQSGQKEEALSRLENFLKTYPTNERVEDALFLAGNVALDLKKPEEAEAHYSQLIQRFPKSENLGIALMKRAEIAETKYEFAKAANDFQMYLGLSESKDQKKGPNLDELRRRILLWVWLENDATGLGKALQSKNICTKDLEEDCDRYKVLHEIRTFAVKNPSEQREILKHAFDYSMRAPKSNRSLWALLAMQSMDHYAFPDRMLLVRLVVGRWSDIDPLIQFSLLPDLSKNIPLAFELNRKDLNKFSKIQANEKSIKRRIALIKEMEDTAASALKLSWSRVRAQVLQEVGTLYWDLAQGLNALPAPEGMPEQELAEYQAMIRKIVVPFEEKGIEIQNRAFEIAGRFSIDSESFNRVSKAFFEANPSQGKTLKGEIGYDRIVPVNTDLLSRLAPDIRWKKILSPKFDSPTENEPLLFSRWAAALKAKNWPQVAFYVSRAAENKALPVTAVSLLRSVSLVEVGARGEALMELYNQRAQFTDEQRGNLMVVLISHSVSTLDKKRTRELIEELEKSRQEASITNFVDNDDEAFLIAYGADWSGATLSDQSRNALLREATGAHEKLHRLWAKQALNEIEMATIARAPAGKK